MVTDFIWNLSAWSVAHSVCCECRLWTCLRREGEWKDNSLRTGSNNSVLTVFGNLDISSQERNLMPIVLCVDWTMKQQDDPCYRSPEMITWVRTSAVLSSSPTSGHANWEPVHLCKHQACSSSTSGSTQRGCFVLFCFVHLLEHKSARGREWPLYYVWCTPYPILPCMPTSPSWLPRLNTDNLKQ